MALSPLPMWHTIAHANLVWRHWGDEYVFHHALSNDTHRLSRLAGQLVVHLATTGERSAEDLTQYLGLDQIDAEAVLAELANLDFVACRL